MSTSASSPHPAPSQGAAAGCCSSGVTLELVGAFTAVCLLLYGFILYLNYLYMTWTGRDGVNRTTSGAGAAAPRKRAGLDPSAVAALPTSRFRAEPHGEGGAGAAECVVCLSALQDGDAVRELPGCMHTFHVGCIDAWLCAHATCPVCRARPALPAAGGGGRKGQRAAHDLESQVHL